MIPSTFAPSPFAQFLRRELRTKPGRFRAVARTAIACSLTVAVAMVFQIPLPAYMAYVVLLVSRDESAGTLISALGGLVAATVALALSLLIYMLGASEPALRIPLLVVSTFTGVFFTRTCSLGPIIFLAGFILVLSQTLVDDIPSPELLTHLLLWLWLVVAIPAVVTTVINIVLGDSPVTVARQRVLQLMDGLAGLIASPNADDAADLREEILALAELRKHAQLWDNTLRDKAAIDSRMIEMMAELFQLAQAIPSATSDSIRRALAQAMQTLRHDFANNVVSNHDNSDIASTVGFQPTVLAMARALDELRASMARRSSAVDKLQKGARSLFVADAFSNVAYIKFALKVTLAVIASYVTYTLLDWPGTRTAVTTCFFIALGTLGESMHKLTLRLAGAVIGGTGAGVCIVFILPLMTDIGQLLVLIAIVSALCAWVATSSARLNYAGLQMAFAFFLGVLQSYGPATDLTILRDRVVGILVGNIWMSIAFGVIWPVTSSAAAQSALASALSGAAHILRVRPHAAGAYRYAAVQKLNEAHRLAAVAMFEWKFRSSIATEAVNDKELADAADRIVSAVFAISREPGFEPEDGLTQEGQWLQNAGALLANKANDAIFTSDVVQEKNSVETASKNVSRARTMLREEIVYATSLR